MGFSGVMGVGIPQRLTVWAWRWRGRGFRPLGMPRGAPLPKFFIFKRCIEVRQSAQGCHCVYDVQNCRP